MHAFSACTMRSYAFNRSLTCVTVACSCVVGGASALAGAPGSLDDGSALERLPPLPRV